MTDLIGTTLGHYRVTAMLGKGGMGEVYRAMDERLEREVAIKVLPNRLADDPERLARFEREARLLASLNHPQVATLHGLEEHEGRRFLVMELAEGESLAARINKGRIPIDDALDYARQIAEGLEVAHAQGIIHRDLKPANVMVSEDGAVRVLDFGLAKAFDPEVSGEQSAESLTHSPTISADMTRPGIVLGTAAYMSPEQARGKAIDTRTDIWSFGCVLFEMLTGRRPFDGDTSTETMAAILKEEPEWIALPPSTPRAARRLLRRCLQKHPDRRLHHIADARIELGEANDREPGPSAGFEKRFWKAGTVATATATAALLGLAGGSLGVWRLTRTPSPAPIAVQVETLQDLADNVGRVQHPVISPDGKHLVYAQGAYRADYLVHRPLGDFAAETVEGSENAQSPCFSPDSRWVAFTVDGKLMKSSLQGGPPEVLCEDCGGPAAWSPDGTEIIFTRERSLHRVASVGGEVSLIAEPATEDLFFSRPDVLPDGGAVLVEVCSRESLLCDIAVFDLWEEQLEILAREGSNPSYAASGHLLFARGGELFAAVFDADRRRVLSEPVQVLGGVSSFSGRNALYDVSDNGVLAFIEFVPVGWASDRNDALVWVDRGGTTTRLSERRNAFGRPSLSPDGTRVAVRIVEDVRLTQIEIFDIGIGTWTRLTTGDGFKLAPTWTPDGSRIVFSTGFRVQGVLIYQLSSIASDFSSDGATQLLEHDAHAFPRSFSPSGDLVFAERSGIDDMNLLRLPSANGEVEDLVHTRFRESDGRVSPDGRWLAYDSNRSGIEQVYVQPYPDGGARIQVSDDGGSYPLWGDGELFYSSSNRMIAVPVRTSPDFAITGERQVLFEDDSLVLVFVDVDREGRRFLVVQQGDEDPQAEQTRRRVQLVFNWFTDLERLVPTG